MQDCGVLYVSRMNLIPRPRKRGALLGQAQGHSPKETFFQPTKSSVFIQPHYNVEIVLDALHPGPGELLMNLELRR